MPTAPWSGAARFIFGPAISPQRHPVTPFSRQWNRFPPRPLKRARGPSTAETGHADDILQSADQQPRQPTTRLQVSVPVPDAPSFRCTAGWATAATAAGLPTAGRPHDHRRGPAQAAVDGSAFHRSSRISTDYDPPAVGYCLPFHILARCMNTDGSWSQSA